MARAAQSLTNCKKTKSKKQSGWDLDASAAENAKARLPALARKYFAKGRKLMAEEPGRKDLHRFRLRTKFVRYSIELFTSCYGPEIQMCLSSLQKIQTFLGDINDCVTTQEMIAGILEAESEERRRIERSLDRRAERLEAQLRRYWRTSFDKPGEMERWTEFLSGKAALPIATPGKKPPAA
jgi:CHAD domain-containing protein